MKRSTNTAPVSLSTSYLIGSPCIGISMITLQSLGTPLPAETRSRFMAAHDESAGRYYSGHARADCDARAFPRGASALLFTPEPGDLARDESAAARRDI